MSRRGRILSSRSHHFASFFSVGASGCKRGGTSSHFPFTRPGQEMQSNPSSVQVPLFGAVALGLQPTQHLLRCNSQNRHGKSEVESFESLEPVANPVDKRQAEGCLQDSSRRKEGNACRCMPCPFASRQPLWLVAMSDHCRIWLSG